MGEGNRGQWWHLSSFYGKSFQVGQWSTTISLLRSEYQCVTGCLYVMYLKNATLSLDFMFLWDNRNTVGRSLWLRYQEECSIYALPNWSQPHPIRVYPAFLLYLSCTERSQGVWPSNISIYWKAPYLSFCNLIPFLKFHLLLESFNWSVI